MLSKLYAQFNEEGICICVGTPKTDVEATYDCIGMKYIENQWIDPAFIEEVIAETEEVVNGV